MIFNSAAATSGAIEPERTFANSATLHFSTKAFEFSAMVAQLSLAVECFVYGIGFGVLVMAYTKH